MSIETATWQIWTLCGRSQNRDNIRHIIERETGCKQLLECLEEAYQASSEEGYSPARWLAAIRLAKGEVSNAE